MKKIVRTEAAPGLFVETLLVAVPAIVVLAVLHRRREGTFGNAGTGHAVLLVGSRHRDGDPAAAVRGRRPPDPAVDRRAAAVPDPADAAGDRCLRLRRAHAARPAGRFRHRLGGPGGVHRRHAATRPGGQSASGRRGGPRGSLRASGRPVGGGRPRRRGKRPTPGLPSAPSHRRTPVRPGTAGERRRMTDDLPPVVSPPRAEGSGEASVQVPSLGAVPPGARDAHLRAAVVAAGGGQGDGDSRPVRGHPDALLPGAQRSGRPAGRAGRSTRCSSGGSGGCDSRGNERVRLKVLCNESYNG